MGYAKPPVCLRRADPHRRAIERGSLERIALRQGQRVLCDPCDRPGYRPIARVWIGNYFDIHRLALAHKADACVRHVCLDLDVAVVGDDLHQLLAWLCRLSHGGQRRRLHGAGDRGAQRHVGDRLGRLHELLRRIVGITADGRELLPAGLPALRGHRPFGCQSPGSSRGHRQACPRAPKGQPGPKTVPPASAAGTYGCSSPRAPTARPCPGAR